jgi:hypothetical protein
MTACMVCQHFYPCEWEPAYGTAMPGTCRLQLPPWLRPGPDAEPDRAVDGHDGCDLGTPLTPLSQRLGLR